LKDKLWFFAGIQPSFQRYQVTRRYYALRTDPITNAPLTDPVTGLTLSDPIPGGRSDFFADRSALQYIAKLTYLINSDNRVSLSVIGTPSWSGGPGKFGIGANTQLINGFPLTGTPLNGNINSITARILDSSTDVSAKWNSSFFEKRLLVDGT